MANPDLRSSDASPKESEPAVHPGVQRGARGEEKHAPSTAAPDPDPSAQSATNEPDDRSGLDRAEGVVDSLAAKLSSLASRWGRQFLRLASRARESIQDFWAEVQDFRRGKKP
jgi:hypothetical protein